MRVALTIIALVLTWFFVCPGAGRSQDDKAVTDEAAAVETGAETELLWIWGEVVLVDVQKKQILVKYLDYETDSEKQAFVNVDDNTVYENAQSLADIKPLDTVSIDYRTGPDASLLAATVSVEKPEPDAAAGPEAGQQ